VRPDSSPNKKPQIDWPWILIIAAAWVWLKAKIAARAQLEQGAVADVKSRVTALENDVAALKKSVPSAPAAGVLAAPAP
jgi:hypothetical protein